MKVFRSMLFWYQNFNLVISLSQLKCKTSKLMKQILSQDLELTNISSFHHYHHNHYQIKLVFLSIFPSLWFKWIDNTITLSYNLSFFILFQLLTKSLFTRKGKLVFIYKNLANWIFRFQNTLFHGVKVNMLQIIPCNSGPNYAAVCSTKSIYELNFAF